MTNSCAWLIRILRQAPDATGSITAANIEIAKQPKRVNGEWYASTRYWVSSHSTHRHDPRVRVFQGVLFPFKGADRVHPRYPKCRYQARRDRGDRHYREGPGERRRIPRAHLIEKVAHEARCSGSDPRPHHDARHREPDTVSHHHPQQVGALRSESHAQPQLARSLRDRV
jgi:hypothetical protein